MVRTGVGTSVGVSVAVGVAVLVGTGVLVGVSRIGSGGVGVWGGGDATGRVGSATITSMVGVAVAAAGVGDTG
jgi:hypothetical protein